MLAPTVLEMAGSGACPLACAALLLGGWMVPVGESSYWLAIALSLWALRKHVPVSAVPYLRVAAAGIGLLILARIARSGWTTLSHPPASGQSESKGLVLARSIMEMEGLPLALAFLVGYGILRSRSLAIRGAIALALGTVTALAAPGALRNPRPEGSGPQIAEFADWRQVIPRGENVFVASRYYSPGFAWFTLQRPSYLTVDQSSGVIFSRDTAVEIRRRSQILLPMEQPDWRLMSNRAAGGGKFVARPLPLTRERLVQICEDPALNYVVAKEDVGFGPWVHRAPGAWNAWNLYDCSRVNSPASSK
jgi:hypothetical protein